MEKHGEVNLNDCKNALVVYNGPEFGSGQAYVIRYCSVWEGDKPVGTLIINATLADRHLLNCQTEMLTASDALFNQIDNWPFEPNQDQEAQGYTGPLSGDELAWLQAQDNAGNLLYPIGVR